MEYLRASRRGSADSSAQVTPYGNGFCVMRTYKYVYESHAIASFTFVTVPADTDEY